MKELWVCVGLTLITTADAFSKLPTTFISKKEHKFGIVSTSGSEYVTPIFTSLNPLDNGCYWVSSNPTNDLSGQMVSQFGEPVCEPVFLCYHDPIFPIPPSTHIDGAVLLPVKYPADGLEHDFLVYPDGQAVDLGQQHRNYLNTKQIVSQKLPNGLIGLYNIAARRNQIVLELDDILCSGLPNVGIAHIKGKYGLIDFSGKYILPCTFDSISFDWFSRGTFIVRSGSKQGIYNIGNGWYIPLKDNASIDTGDFGHLFRLHAGNATYILEPQDGKFRELPIGAKLKEVAFCSFSYTQEHENILGTLENDRVFSMHDCSIRSMCKDEIKRYGGGDIWVVEKDGEKYLSIYIYQGIPYYFKNSSILIKKRWLPQPKALFLVITENEMEKMRILSIDAKKTIVQPFDSRGKVVSSWRDKILIRDVKTQLISIVTLNGKVLVDFSDKISFATTIDLAFSDYTHIVHSGKAGLIDGDCNFVLPCQYEDVGHFGEGLVPAKQGGKWGFVELSGRWAITPRFDEARSFKDGFAPVCVGGKWGFVGKDGKPRTPFAYEDVKDVREGHFRAQVNGKWGVFALDGTCKLPPEYDRILSDDEPDYGDPR